MRRQKSRSCDNAIFLDPNSIPDFCLNRQRSVSVPYIIFTQPPARRDTLHYETEATRRKPHRDDRSRSAAGKNSGRRRKIGRNLSDAAACSEIIERFKEAKEAGTCKDGEYEFR